VSGESPDSGITPIIFVFGVKPLGHQGSFSVLVSHEITMGTTDSKPPSSPMIIAMPA
jgi:hypothetical protein